ncbi:hypothetical protein MRB53_024021 [Persea americana]|uniref:Uncharacterized protein n=1 Tax=Persea americana TaxID=3435 RepID=A0ACC2LBK9_PERAE|nr:hypothetical protein MRB53_024021 [Persea americana]
MTDYLEKIKKLSDSLGAVGQPVDDEDLIHHTTRGLPAEYDPICASIRISSSSFNEVQFLLLSEEIILEERQQPTLSTDSSLTAIVAARNQNNSSGSGSGRGGNNFNRGHGRGRGCNNGRGNSNQFQQSGSN